MNQIACVPPINPYTAAQAPKYMTTAQVQQPQQPNYNAVKIDIHNPSVGAPNAPQAPIYAYPQAPIYGYPEAPAGQVPVYIPTQPLPTCIPVPEYPQTPVDRIPVDQKPADGLPQSQIPVPQPQDIEQQDKVQDVKKSETPVETQKPEIVEGKTVEPQFDLNAFIAKLANPDFDVQTDALNEVSKMVNNQPEQAKDLVDTKVFEALNNIIAADTSNLEGPTKEQLDAREKFNEGKALSENEVNLANTMSPSEKAEFNKSLALYATAIIGKLYADEVAKLSSNTVPLTELPGVTTLVDQLKDNANPKVRASAVEALSYLQRPEYKEDLNTLFTVAQTDQDALVAQMAKEALDKLNEIK